MVRHSPFPLSLFSPPFQRTGLLPPSFIRSLGPRKELFGAENPSLPPAYNVRENSSFLLQAEVALYTIAITAKNRVILYAQLLTLLYFGRITIFTP